MKRLWCVVVFNSDRSGVVRTFGPFDSRSDAEDSQEGLRDVFDIHHGIGEIYPMLHVAPEELT